MNKVTLDGVEYNVVPSDSCSALGVKCHFITRGGCDARLDICGGPAGSIFLDDTRLLQYLTKRITG